MKRKKSTRLRSNEMAARYRGKAALERFEEAVREHAFIGAKDPTEHQYVEKEYHEAKANLIEFLRSK